MTLRRWYLVHVRNGHAFPQRFWTRRGARKKADRDPDLRLSSWIVAKR